MAVENSLNELIESKQIFVRAHKTYGWQQVAPQNVDSVTAEKGADQGNTGMPEQPMLCAEMSIGGIYAYPHFDMGRSAQRLDAENSQGCKKTA